MLEKGGNKEVYGIYFLCDARSAPNMKTYGTEELMDTAFEEVVKTGFIEFGNEQLQVVNARKFKSIDSPYFDYETIRKRRKEESTVG